MNNCPQIEMNLYIIGRFRSQFKFQFEIQDDIGRGGILKLSLQF